MNCFEDLRPEDLRPEALQLWRTIRSLDKVELEAAYAVLYAFTQGAADEEAVDAGNAVLKAAGRKPVLVTPTE